jgi:hypothetical protein
VTAVAQTVERAVATITEDDIARRIGVIADDSMRGRNTPSPELDQVAAYIADEFRRLGLAPGGDDGGFIQRYTLFEERLDLVVRLSSGDGWRPGTDVVQVGGGDTDSVVTGPAVLVTGNGQLPASPRLTGAVVFVSAGLDERRSGLTEEGRDLLEAINLREPAAVVLVADFSPFVWRFLSRRQSMTQVRKGWQQASSDGPPLLAVRADLAQQLLGQHGLAPSTGGAVAAHTLDGLNVTVQAARTAVETSAPNVVGILEGSDPELKREYVLFSAHMDHVGVGNPIDGDSIYNGADDDASGTIAVVEAAEAFATLNPRPKRSMIFLLVSGEEKGLWGSEYYAERPTVPITDVVANLNADMVGRNWPDTVNDEHPELNMTAIDDIWPEERFYFRSDHYNFARKGVPILFFFSGTHEDYHRPSDHPEAIDAEKESRIVRLMFYLGLDVANAAERPRWDPESYRQIVEAPVP